MHGERDGKAINFIIFDQQQGFIVSEEARELLMSLKDDHIGVIAVAGMYRTGKSFLLNRIILEETSKNGFGVGPTINPCTKGLWIWNKPIDLVDRNSEKTYKCLVVDSEGIGAFNEDKNHDTRIFLLALLISSYFIYNSMGTIDETALQSLSLIVNLSKQIQINRTRRSNLSADDDAEYEDPEELAKYFPSFMWIVRDFALRLIDQFGNQITSKEYLENALKEVKGHSDAIEAKNKIRRMINSFFQDRDCYTMVRPTENEKDLQYLQQLSDGEMRPEFVNQMQQLRQRIFKRVKPKTLNGKFITGATLLELCEAYTEAINKGSVPCIESAWTYVCKNECQRAQLDSINLYKNELGALMRQEIPDCDNLRRFHKELLISSFNMFRSKAIGDNLDQYEISIEEEIRKEYTLVKQKCMTESKKKCERAIKQDLDKFNSEVRQSQYKTEMELQQKVDILKAIFKETLAEIKYKEKDSFLEQICSNMINSGLKNLLQQAKLSTKEENHLLKGKIDLLESDIKNNKAEANEEKRYLQDQLAQAQSESRQTEVLLTQRFENEKAKVKELEDKYKNVDKEREKEQALSEQKISFMEKDMQGLQEQIEQSQSTVRELQGRLDETQKTKQSFINKNEETIHVLQQQLVEHEQLELSKKFEIEQLKLHYENEIKKLKEQEIENTQNQLWEEKEKKMMEEMQQNQQKQQEEMLNMQKNLMEAIQNQQQNVKTEAQAYEKQKTSDELFKTNQSLSETIAKVEDRNKQLTQKVNNVKIYQRVFKHSISMQCKFCNVFFPAESFIDHVKTCTKDSSGSRSVFFKIPLSLQIIATRMVEDDTDNRTYTEYVIKVKFNGQSWSINQKYRAFCSLHDSLINQYPSLKFPDSSYQFAQRDFGSGLQLTSSTTQVEERMKNLQSYLQDLALIPAIKESVQFKLFLGISQKCPEFSESFHSSLIPKDFGTNTNQQRSPIQRKKSPRHVPQALIDLDEQNQRRDSPPPNISPRNQNGPNFKIIGDLFKPSAPISSRQADQEGQYKMPNQSSGHSNMKANYMLSYDDRHQTMNLAFQERVIQQSPKSSRVYQQESVYQNEKKPNSPKNAQNQMFRPNSGNQVQHHYQQKVPRKHGQKQHPQQQIPLDSDEDDIGDESGTVIQHSAEKISPTICNQKASPRLFYGERTRESFSLHGVAPGSKLRQSEIKSPTYLNESQTSHTNSHFTDDPEKIYIPNRSAPQFYEHDDFQPRIQSSHSSQYSQSQSQSYMNQYSSQNRHETYENCPTTFPGQGPTGHQGQNRYHR